MKPPTVKRPETHGRRCLWCKTLATVHEGDLLTCGNCGWGGYIHKKTGEWIWFGKNDSKAINEA